MCQPEELAGYGLLSDLTPDQLAAVAELARVVTFDAGARIIEEGREANRCWLIRSGQVSLQTRLPNDTYCTVQTLGTGDVLGWSWLLPPHRWRFDGLATEPVTAVELDAVALHALADRDCKLGYAISARLVEALAERLLGTRARLLDMYGTRGDD